MNSKKLILIGVFSRICFIVMSVMCVLSLHTIWDISVEKNIGYWDKHKIAGIFIILMTAIEILYFIYALPKTYKQTIKKEKAFYRAVYMYDVQKILFDAYKSPNNISIALDKVASMLSAETAFLFNIKGRYIDRVYFSGEDSPDWVDYLCSVNVDKWNMPFVKLLKNGESVLYYGNDKKYSDISDAELELLSKYDINSIMIAPVRDSDNSLVGMLGCINMFEKWNDSLLLECVVLNFLMSVKNVESYRTVCEMGTIDNLTGLKNRNSYQNAVTNYSLKDWHNFGCVYVDANALHEVNNTLGHDTGDKMLKYIAETLKVAFDVCDIYRIGGDEFVVFSKNRSKEEFYKEIDNFKNRVSEYGPDVAVGVSWLGENTVYIDKLTSEAEQKMYDDKHRYYNEQGNLHKIRKLNLKLEKMLTEKKDADNFMSIVSTYFMAVYMVDIDSDNTRAICCPPCFLKSLENNDYKFKPAILDCAGNCVHKDDRKGLVDFLNYDAVYRELCNNNVPEYRYRKPDGKMVIIRIYGAKGFCRNLKETYWFFEEYK